MADNDKILELTEDLLGLAETPRKDFLKLAKHAHYLFNNNLDRWIPGTEDPLDINDGHPVSTENMIQPMLLDAVSLLLKNYPMFRIKPTKAIDFDLTDELNKHVLSAWQDAGIQRTLQLSQLEALITGLCVLEVSPEWDVTDGEVRLVCELVPREDVWFDPKEITPERSWVIKRSWHTLRQLELDWGEDLVKEALEATSSIDWQNESDEEYPDWWNEVDDLYPLYTLWLMPKVYDPEISSAAEITEAPYGRKIELLNKQVLRDVPNPYATTITDPETGTPRWIGHKTHPFIIHECNRVTDASGYSGFYDVNGLVNSMESSQWELNELSRILMQLGRRVAQPPIIAPEGSLTDPTQNVSYTAGKVITWDPTISPTPPQAVPLPGDVGYVQYLHMQRKNALREISGVREFMTGGGTDRPGTSHTPAATIASVQEASFTRMWTIVSALDRAIQGVAKRMLGIMQQFYTPGRFQAVSVAGDQWFGEWQQKYVETEFRIEIVSGMSTPLRDLDRVSTATQVYQALLPIVQGGVAPHTMPMLQLAKAYLQTINEPAAWEFLNLINSMIEEQTQQQMMQQQMMQPGGVPQGYGEEEVVEEEVPQELEALPDVVNI